MDAEILTGGEALRLGGEALRHNLYLANLPALRKLYIRATDRGLSGREFMLVCIDADDPTWTDMVDSLMPGEDWQHYRDRGEKPVARGSVDRAGMADYLSKAVPAIGTLLLDGPGEGAVHVVVMADGGASVYLM